MAFDPSRTAFYFHMLNPNPPTPTSGADKFEHFNHTHLNRVTSLQKRNIEDILQLLDISAFITNLKANP